ncbi:hypothetical protein AUJ17_05055 [Candidatus Micrarchaeota archaeon CG1_02_47_40]|nr:MAG: hypothetical protein AUJ17_05055 [Candidatus Micrarchaeota archaeon CG1_02_47_40]
MLYDLSDMYRRRLGGDLHFRGALYSLLCREFFQRRIPADSTVLEVAAGYCEFINHIRAKRKIALDLNPEFKKFAAPEVETLISQSTNIKLPDGSIDVVFVSNFFEHITKDDILHTLREIRRVLKDGGSLLIMQPNIRYCFNDFWMFFDHITPLDDRSLVEILELNDFKITECKPRFLPFSLKNTLLPKSLLLLKIYLRFPILHSIFGQQAFIHAKK